MVYKEQNREKGRKMEKIDENFQVFMTLNLEKVINKKTLKK